MYTSEKYKDDVMVFSSLLFFLLHIENKIWSELVCGTAVEIKLKTNQVS